VTVGAGGGALVVVLDDDSLLARIAALKEHNDLVGLREMEEKDRQRRCPEGGFAAKAIFPQRRRKISRRATDRRRETGATRVSSSHDPPRRWHGP
jgi:hypothetical protein